MKRKTTTVAYFLTLATVSGCGTGSSTVELVNQYGTPHALFCDTYAPVMYGPWIDDVPSYAADAIDQNNAQYLEECTDGGIGQ